jgi:multiple sugar transport system substrate-binding protein
MSMYRPNPILKTTAAIAVTLLASCTEPTEKKLTILGENSGSLQAMQIFTEEYAKSTGVVLDFKPNSFEDAFTKSNQDFANGTGLYDLVLQYNFSLSSFFKNDYVYTLDELKQMSPGDDAAMEADLFPNVWKEVGHFYADPKNRGAGATAAMAYPFAANTMLLTYNKALFDDPAQQAAYRAKYNEELAVPQDLEKFRRVAEFFTQPDKGLSGVCLQGSTGGWLYYEWCGILQALGGKVMDKDQGWKGDATTPVLLDSPEAIAAAEYYLSLKPFNAGNFTTTDGVEQRNIMKQGKVAMALIWSDYVQGLIEDGAGKRDDRFGFAPAPGGRSMIAGGSFYINKKSKSPKEAFELVRFLLKKENQVRMLQHGLCSPMRSAYDAPEVQDVPFAAALKTSLERAEYMLEAGPDADLISTSITTALQRIWNGQSTIPDGLRAAKEQIEKERAAFYE